MKISMFSISCDCSEYMFDKFLMQIFNLSCMLSITVKQETFVEVYKDIWDVYFYKYLKSMCLYLHS